jgi:hypothetical protein
MRSSKPIFDKAITDAFTKQSNIKLNADTIGDAMKYQQDMKEEDKMESKEATTSASSGSFSAPIFTKEEEMEGKKEEAKEATTSASSGAYSTPAFIAKNSKNWRGGKKPIYKGGKFVKIKKKCLTFPYCNQGAGAIDLSEIEKRKDILSNVSQRLGLSESTILDILSKINENKIKK